MKEYIDIETKIHVRSEKTNKLDVLIERLKIHHSLFPIEDILYISHYLLDHNITIRYPLFLHVIYPALSSETDKDNIDAIKMAIRLSDYYGGYTHHFLDVWELIGRGLKLAPVDSEWHERSKCRRMRFTFGEAWFL